jgi:hypothetical protein
MSITTELIEKTAKLISFKNFNQPTKFQKTRKVYHSQVNLALQLGHVPFVLIQGAKHY